VWELPVTGGAGTKADEDYDKRTTSPDGGSPATTVYVQVILAPWTKARQWAASRTAEGRWREVRAYNLDAVHSWLDRAPATAVWLAEQLGKAMHGVRLADDWLTRTWLFSTAVPLDVECILAGRDESAAGLLSALASGQATVTVAGDLTVDEFHAVVAASMTRADPAIRDALQARALLVNDSDSLAQLVVQPQPLVLVLADPRLAVQLPDGHGHQLVVRAPQGSKADVTVGPVDAQSVSALLHTAGEPWERAERLGALARRSLSGLRRRLSRNPAALRPSWADNADTLRRRLLLLGSWEGSNPADREVVEDVTGCAYTDAEDAALALAGTEDIPMLGRRDEHWHVLAAEDASEYADTW
jgi:hypothetical protein